jgi:glyoxylase-like metal-dependent hydrolase (beta-lactamase superfamily II)
MEIYEVNNGVYCVDTLVGGQKEAISCFILDFERAAIVEAGPISTYRTLLEALDEIGVRKDRVRYIAVTHIHLDHGGASGALLKELPEAKVITHPLGVKHLVDPSKLWKVSSSILGSLADIYGQPLPVEANRIIAAEDGLKVTLSGEELVVLHSPGHAPHHAAFFLENSRILFPGDAAGMFMDGYLIPTTPPPFRLDLAVKSLERFEGLNPLYIGFTHFGMSQADDYLDKAIEKKKLWVQVAEEVVEAGGGVEELHAKLLEVDEDYRNLCRYYSSSDIILRMYKVGLMGLVEFVRNGR